MRDMGNKILLHLVELAQAPRHRVEVASQLRKFILSRRVQLINKVAISNSPRPLDQVFQWFRNGTNGPV